MEDIGLWILIALTIIIAGYIGSYLGWHGIGGLALLIFAGLAFVSVKGGPIVRLILILVFILLAGRILISIFVNHVKSVEIKARNHFFQVIGLSQMINNCRETSPFGAYGSTNPMMKAYTNGTYTVTFTWSDWLRAEANRGREPSFTEPMMVHVNGPNGEHHLYRVENLGVPSMTVVEPIDN